MPGLIIFSSFVIALVAYFALSIQVKNYINVLTPVLFFQVPAYYFLEPIHLYLFGTSGSDFAYFYCYATYTLEIVAFALGYLAMPDTFLPVFPRLPKVIVPGAAYIVLGCGTLLFLPILIKFSTDLLNPRAIYAATRTGYGTEFFLSSFAVYISFVLLLFSGSRHRGLGLLFVAVALGLLYLHGSKGHVLNFLLIALYFAVFVKKRRFGLGRMIRMAAAISAVILLLFYLTLSVGTRSDLIDAIAGYSDYTRNAMLVIDDPSLPIQYGRLSLQEDIYSLVPRALYPDKPKDFGALWLAERYYPSRYEADTGAPAFGIGVGYADFGDFAFVYYSLLWCLSGMFAKVLVTRLSQHPDAGTFVLLLVMLEVQLVPAGAAVPFIAYYICAIGVRCLSRDRVRGVASLPINDLPARAG